MKGLSRLRTISALVFLAIMLFFPVRAAELVVWITPGKWCGHFIENAQPGFIALDSSNHRLLRLDSSYNVTGQIGDIGQEPGFFFNPLDVALAKNGDICVIDAGNKRVQCFSSNGHLLSVFSFKVLPTGIAIDSHGRIILGMPTRKALAVVVNRDGKVVQEIGVQHSVSNLFAVPVSDRDDKYTFSLSRVRVAVDKLDNIYIAFIGAPIVEKYTSEGVFVCRFSLPERFRQKVWSDFNHRTGHHSRYSYFDAPFSIPNFSTGLTITNDQRVVWLVNWDRTTLHILSPSLASDVQIDLGLIHLRDIAASERSTTIFGIGASPLIQNVVYQITLPSRNETANQTSLDVNERR